MKKIAISFVIPMSLIFLGTAIFFIIDDKSLSSNPKLSIILKTFLSGFIIGLGWIWNFVYEEKTKDQRFSMLIESLADSMLVLMSIYTGLKILML